MLLVFVTMPLMFTMLLVLATISLMFTMLRQRVVPMSFYFSGPTYDSLFYNESSYAGPLMHINI